MDLLDPGRVRAAAEFLVNGQKFEFDDPIIEVREALDAAGLTPASEHQVILVEKGRTHLLERRQPQSVPLLGGRRRRTGQGRGAGPECPGGATRRPAGALR